MKRTVWLFFLAIAALLLPASALAAQDYHAEHFDVDLVIQPDGTLLVTETVEFAFSGDPFTFVFRDLEYAELDAIDQIEAYMDGQRLPEGTGPGQVEIITGRPTRVTWHFAPTTNSSHTFTLSYRVLGAIRDLQDADRLVWRAIPETHEYPIRASLITLTYPDGASLLEPPTLSIEAAQLESGGNQVALSAQDIDSDTPVDIMADFTPGSLVQEPPAWQAAQSERARQVRQALPVGLATAGIVISAGLVLLLVIVNRLRSDRLPPASVRPTSPPSQIKPALAAQLVGSGSPVLGTLFDLAERGHLQIEEGPKRWTGRTYELILLPDGRDELDAHEQGLLQALFETRRGAQESIALSEVGARLAQHSKLYLEPLEDEMLARGWQDPQRKSRNNRLMIVALTIDILSAFVLVAGFFMPTPMLRAPLIGAGAAGTLLSTIALVYFASLSTLTEEGERRKAVWKGFADYLKDVTRGKEPALRPDTFELYLSYAASFGLAQQWAKHFEKREGVPIPTWFQALDASQTDFSDITAVIVASTVVMSSGDAGGAAAAGGASGGGASGAG